MPRIRRKQPQVIADTLAFLRQAHAEVKADPQSRMTYAAMTHHLPASTLAAAQEMGLLKRAGWNWYWETSRPTLSMAEDLHQHHKAMVLGRGQRYRQVTKVMRQYGIALGK